MKRKLLWVIHVFLFILFVLFLEVFKNRIFGWVLAVSLFAVFTYFMANALKIGLIKPFFMGYIVYAVLMLVIFFVSGPKEERVPVTRDKDVTKTAEYSVNEGLIRGVYSSDGDVEIFAGIPYAAPPVGDLRWRAPEPAAHWDGVLECDTFAPMAMQQRQNPIYAFGSKIVGFNEIPISLDDNFLEAMSEDCLYLNIWKPSGAEPGDDLPVLFYIHGGSLNSGNTYFYAYNGESFARSGVVFVDIAYRLGVFGYFADDELAEESPVHTTGNYGLLDQIAALRWVNENIYQFGGDASNITIAGESAGSSSVNAVCVSPLAKGLFRRAIAESSGITPKTPYHTFRTMEQAKAVAKSIKDEFKCASISELREIPAEKLVYTKAKNNEMTVDGYAIVEQPYLTYLAGRNNEESVLGGYNGNEADAFLIFNKMPGVDDYAEFLKAIAGDYAEELASVWPASDKADAKKKYKELVGVAWFAYSHYTWSNYMTMQGRPAYLYFFTKQNKSLADWHSGEMPYFYGNIPDSSNYNESDRRLSATIQEYLLNYIRTGDPNSDDLPQWSLYNDDPTLVLNLDEEVKMVQNKYLRVFEVFDKYMGTEW